MAEIKRSSALFMTLGFGLTFVIPVVARPAVLRVGPSIGRKASPTKVAPQTRQSVDPSGASFKNAPSYCPYILSTFIRGYGEHEEESFFEIASLVQDARDLRYKNYSQVSRLADLGPVFETGLIYKALRGELNAQGMFSKTSIDRQLTLFNETQNVGDQIRFVESVFRRLLQLVGPTEYLLGQPKQNAALAKRAHDLGFKGLHSFTAFLQALNQKPEETTVIIELALTEALFEMDGMAPKVLHDKAYLKKVAKLLGRDELRNWKNIAERPSEIATYTGIFKLVRLRTEAFDRRLSHSPGDYVEDFLGFLRGIRQSYSAWVSSEVIAKWCPDLIDTAARIRSDEDFETAVTLIYIGIANSEKRDLKLALKLNTLASHYENTNEGRRNFILKLVEETEETRKQFLLTEHASALPQPPLTAHLAGRAWEKGR